MLNLYINIQRSAKLLEIRYLLTYCDLVCQSFIKTNSCVSLPKTCKLLNLLETIKFCTKILIRLTNKITRYVKAVSVH